MRRVDGWIGIMALGTTAAAALGACGGSVTSGGGGNGGATTGTGDTTKVAATSTGPSASTGSSLVTSSSGSSSVASTSGVGSGGGSASSSSGGVSSSTAGTSASSSSGGVGSSTAGTSASSSGSGTGGSGSASSSSGGALCPTGTSCTAVDQTCLGLVDNSGKTSFGLRMSEIDVSKPAVLSTGLVGTVLAGGVTPSMPSCELLGNATFSWLLAFDTVAGTLRTGGAKPVSSPALGYSFEDDMITQGSTTFHVQPVTYPAAPDAGGKFSTAAGQDLILPVYLDASATSVLLLPVRQLSFVMGTLSASQDCIGRYNATGLDPANNCQPDSTHPLFFDGGSITGFLTLADADSVTISALGESLCVLLSGNATLYGDGASPVSHCKRDASGAIVFQGDWCSTTNMAATSGCADSLALNATFAASSILIDN